MSSRHTITLLVAIIGAAGVIIAALITGIFALLVEQTKTSAGATSVAATFVAQRTVDAPLLQQPYAPQPTFTRLPTQQPYTLIPTPKPNVIVVTPKPEIVTATTGTDQQNPPPGSIILAGQGYTRNGITITLRKSITIDVNKYFGFDIIIENRSGQQLVVLWKNSFIHLRDDKGKVYFQRNQNESDWDRNKQFVIPNGETQQLSGQRFNRDSYTWDSTLDYFNGTIDSATKYFIFTIDMLVGMTNMGWRYDIQ
ncbi:MAG: hypothetical protein FJ009_14040 [Chloroflexi bacterium]|nr:hypothetical protein [Chloroflexota bacterium]